MVRVVLCSALAASVLAGNVKFQSLKTAWDKGSRGDPAAVLDVMVSLKSQNMDQLNAEIQAVSNPDSPRYGQHLSKDEVTELTAPPQRSVDLVAQWLADAGVDAKLGLRNDHFRFQASVGHLEQMFSTTVNEYTHGERSVLQAGDLHTPAEVATALRSIVGLHGTPYKKSHVEAGAQPIGVPDITPTVLIMCTMCKGCR
jgi:tripeptidyl-peptidase-1